MGSEWQLVAVGLIVAAAASYLVRRGWRSWRPSGKGCGGSCGCASGKREENGVHFVSADQLTLRPLRENHESHKSHE